MAYQAVSQGEQTTPSSLSSLPRYDVVIIGAGPYGLSMAAHLAHHPLKVAMFGKPMGFWRYSVHPEITLRSHWSATALSDPERNYEFSHYFATHDQQETTASSVSQPLFIRYGLWFQQQLKLETDETQIVGVERSSEGFIVTLEDHRRLLSTVVIMANGLSAYSYIPPEYSSLPPELMVHSSQHTDYQQYAQKEIAIIGGGPSAVETAVIIQKSGAKVHLITRRPIRWSPPIEEDTSNIPLPGSPLSERTLWQRMRYPDARLSPGWFNWWIENHPYMFHSLPRKLKDKLLKEKGGYRPANNYNLKVSLANKADIHESCTVREVSVIDERKRVQLTLSDGTVIRCDYVLLGTGYRIDLQKINFLAPDIVAQIKTYQDSPILTRHFESTVPGLYFTGLASVASFGPLFRFVTGTDATARNIIPAIVRKVSQAKK
jgi:cation diffusion facilitator CzcD-associated flavoprotein CzcO